MGSLGLPEMLVILVILMLIFGANRLPEIGRGLGKGIRGFKDATREGMKDDSDTLVLRRFPSRSEHHAHVAGAPRDAFAIEVLQQRDRIFARHSIAVFERGDVYGRGGSSGLQPDDIVLQPLQ